MTSAALVKGTNIEAVFCGESISRQCDLLYLAAIESVQHSLHALTNGFAGWKTGFNDDQDRLHHSMTAAAFFAVLQLREDIDIIGLSMTSQSSDLSRGSQVFSISSPFALMCPEALLNSISVGIISQTLPAESVCLLDFPSFEGSEGGAVFSIHASLCGVLTLPLRRSQRTDPEKQIGISTMVCVSDVEAWLFKSLEIVRASNVPKIASSISAPSIELSELTRADRSLVALRVERAWASAILVGSEGFLITNAHIVRPFLNKTSRALRSTASVMLQPYNYVYNGNEGSWKSAELVYCSSGPWDLALLQIRLSSPVVGVDSSQGVGFSVAVEGSMVEVLGHALFVPSHCRTAFSTSGVLSKIVRRRNEMLMLQSSAAVHRGNSGGMLLDSEQRCIGLVTNNTKFSSEGFEPCVIPTLNFSIPAAQLQPLLEYIKTKDDVLLRKLDEPDKVVSDTWALQSPQSRL